MRSAFRGRLIESQYEVFDAYISLHEQAHVVGGAANFGSGRTVVSMKDD